MRLPEKKKPGDPVMAADWNLLLEAIAARTPRPGTGLELIASSGGFAYSKPGPPPYHHRMLPPFAVIVIEKPEANNFLVTLKEGWVIERQPKSGDSPAVNFHMPAYQDKPLNQTPRPQVSMSIGDTLWCKVVTDMAGKVVGVPEIIASPSEEIGFHYRPQNPEASGSDGEYFVKLFRLDDESGVPKVSVFQQSDVEHWAQLWTGENLGYGADVFKGWDDATNIYQFRSIIAEEVSGSEPRITVTQTAEQIVIGVEGAGSGDDGYDSIIINPDGDDIKVTENPAGTFQIHSRPIENDESNPSPIRFTFGAPPTPEQLGPYHLTLINDSMEAAWDGAPTTNPLTTLGLHKIASIVGGGVKNVVLYGWVEDMPEDPPYEPDEPYEPEE
jgi:hypothetical protein